MQLWQPAPCRMMTEAQPQRDAAPFHTTRWTQVRLAKADSEDGRQALADLCDAYYAPVVAYLRHGMRDADAARDFSHAFFAEVLSGGRIHGADQERGRFRSYLLGAVKHFVARQRETGRSLKRGAGLEPVSLEDTEVRDMPDARLPTPDAAFDKQWALTVLERSLLALRSACEAEGRVAFFDHARPLLTGDSSHGDQSEIACLCGMNVEAFRVAVHRLKRRLRQCVKAEIAGTLEDATAVEDEMQTLYAALGG